MKTKKEKAVSKPSQKSSKKKDAKPSIPVDNRELEPLVSSQAAITPQETPAEDAGPKQEQKIMTLTLKGLDKRGRNAIYTGAAVALRIPVGAFPSKQAPATWEVPGLAEKVAKTPRAKLTPEERKALRAAQPKLTAAEKIAKAEERLAKAKAKLAAQEAVSAGM